MISHKSKKFRETFRLLPDHIQRKARESYRLFKQNPYHKSLHYKQVHPIKPIYSVRVGLGYRAVGIKRDQHMLWFWIGSHEEYNKLIAQL